MTALSRRQCESFAASLGSFITLSSTFVRHLNGVKSLPQAGQTAISQHSSQSKAMRRWNSAFIMIVCALLLRQHIDYFCYHHRSIKENDNGLKIEQMLTPEDWLILTQLAEASRCSTLQLSHLKGTQRTPNLVQCESACLCSKYYQITLSAYRTNTRYQRRSRRQTSRVQMPQSRSFGVNLATEFMCKSVNHAWKKFQEYYKLTD
jgi:hypothetical protein